MPASPSESPFCPLELQHSLREQSFGIRSFRISPSTSPETATASVVLLEGQTVIIQLTLRGYSIINPSSSVNHVEAETLEGLLQSVSPLYTTKRHDAIATALSSLA